MYVVCIDNGVMDIFSSQANRLTIGKKYQAVEMNDGSNTYKIIDDVNEQHWYSRLRFVPLKEYRKQKLKRICLK